MMPMERPFDIICGLIRRSKSFGPCNMTHNHGDACRATGLRLRNALVNGQASIVLEGLLENQGWALTMSGMQWSWRAITSFPGTSDLLHPAIEKERIGTGAWFCASCRQYWPVGGRCGCQLTP